MDTTTPEFTKRLNEVSTDLLKKRKEYLDGMQKEGATDSRSLLMDGWDIFQMSFMIIRIEELEKQMAGLKKGFNTK